MPRYVILEHDYPSLHWDFMLEAGDVLRTWRLAAPPEPGQEIAATLLSDHRRMYLDYEGPVGCSRGRVVRWDRGMFSWQETQAACIAVDLNGLRLHGAIVLERLDAEKWVLKFAD